jgi:hypothetical protein
MMTAKLKLTASTDNLQLNMKSKQWPETQLHLHSDFVKRGDNGKKKKTIMNLAGIKTKNLHLRQYHISKTIRSQYSLVEIFMCKTDLINFLVP